MKKLLPLVFAVIVYLNNGKVFTYPNAISTHTTGGSQPLIGADTADNVVEILNEHYDVIAAFPLHNVERWEVK